MQNRACKRTFSSPKNEDIDEEILRLPNQGTLTEGEAMVHTLDLLMKLSGKKCRYQWKRFSRKQSARWQHLSWLKARALFSLKKKNNCMKCNNLYSGLVTPSSGWWSPIGGGLVPSSQTVGSFMRTPGWWSRVGKWSEHSSVSMGLYHPLDGDTNLKYKLLGFLTPNK